MQFSELTLEKVILEVRYDTAYLFWDNSGKAMSLLQAKYPKLELRDAQISNVQSDWWDEGIVLNFNHQKADVTQDYPASLDVFKGVCAAVCGAVSDTFGVKSYSRAGVRYFFTYPLKSREAARDFFVQLGIVSLKPEGFKALGNGKIEEEQVMVRFEDEDRGYTFRFAHTPREVTIKVARPVQVQTDKFQKNVIVFDVDCFTKKRVEVPVFVPADFIRVNSKTIESSLLRLLGL